MAMKEGFIRPREVNQRFSERLAPVLSSITKVEVNGYETRGPRQCLEINGKRQMWHSVKGGVAEGKRGSYEILYNPEINEWLKMVPFGARNAEGLENKLRRGADVGRKVLEKSGLVNIALRLQEGEIRTERGTVYGFTTPHIGPTQEFILKERYSLKPDQARVAEELVEKIHATSFHLAARLYLEHGIWTGDPNPGNLVAYFNKRGVTVTIIDFATWPNRKYNGDILYKNLDETDVYLEKNLSALYKGFKEQADIHKIPFSRDSKEVNEAFTLLLPQRKKELRTSRF